MLSIRMQRLGRKGHAMYRVVVQDSHRSPTSGKYVALLGSYDPHSKTSTITKDKAELYLKNGAQPSDRVVKLFKSEKISLPKWVKIPADKKQVIRNPDKLRRNQPKQEKPAEAATTEAPAEEQASTEEPKSEEASTASQPKAEVADEQEPAKIADEDIEKGDDETKTPPGEDEFPEDKKPEDKTTV